MWETIPFATISDAIAVMKATGLEPRQIDLDNGFEVWVAGDFQVAQSLAGGPVKQRRYKEPRAPSPPPKRKQAWISHPPTIQSKAFLVLPRPPYEGQRLATPPVGVKGTEEDIRARWAEIPGAHRYTAEVLVYTVPKDDVSFIYWRDGNGKLWCVRVAPPLYPDSPALPNVPDVKVP